MAGPRGSWVAKPGKREQRAKLNNGQLKTLPDQDLL